MPKQVEDCVNALLSSNPKMELSTAYAICYAQYNNSLNKSLNKKKVLKK